MTALFNCYSWDPVGTFTDIGCCIKWSGNWSGISSETVRRYPLRASKYTCWPSRQMVATPFSLPAPNTSWKCKLNSDKEKTEKVVWGWSWDQVTSGNVGPDELTVVSQNVIRLLLCHCLMVAYAGRVVLALQRLPILDTNTTYSLVRSSSIK